MKFGIDLIDENLSFFEGKRVGLITNPTGINSLFESSIDVLKRKVNLVCLFAPEHGVRGDLQAGVRFESYNDLKSGCKVYSLYTKGHKPTEEMMREIDVLAIDLQDVGSRFYTYIYTMAFAMMACKEYGKEFVVFDRPNPVTASKVEGNILDIKCRSFVGYYPIVQRHGLTIGEIASLFNEEFEIGCNLKIIKMKDYDRNKYYDEYDKTFISPSPNIPSILSCICYNATCIFEGTNVSEGRGTTRPFEYVGAPWIDGASLAEKLNSYNLKGVHFIPYYFTPTFSKYEKELCGGVFVSITSRDDFEAVKTGWLMLDVIRHMYKDDFKVNKPFVEGRPTMLEFNTGCTFIKDDEYTIDEQFDIINKDTKKFEKIRGKYLLY